MKKPSIEDFNLSKKSFKLGFIFSLILFVLSFVLTNFIYSVRNLSFSITLFNIVLFLFIFILLNILSMLTLIKYKYFIGFIIERVIYFNYENFKTERKDYNKKETYLSYSKEELLDKILSKSKQHEWYEFFLNVEEDTVISCINNIIYYPDKKNQEKSIEGLCGLKDDEIIIIGANGEVTKMHYGNFNKNYTVSMFMDKPNLDSVSLCKIILCVSPMEINIPKNVFEFDIFGLAFKNYKTFENHFYSVQNKNFEKRKIFKDNIKNKVNRIILEKDSQTYKDVYRYMNLLPQELFLEVESLIEFENNLLKFGYIGEQTLLTRGLWDKIVTESLKYSEKKNLEKLEASINGKLNLKVEYNYPTEFIGNGHIFEESFFDLITQIMDQNKIFYGEKEVVFGSWYLFRRVAEVYFADKAIAVFGEKIIDLEFAPADKCIRTFKSFNTSRYDYLGIFIYYMISKDKFRFLVEDPNNFIECKEYFMDVLNKKVEE